jgi:dihydroorotate dehydrogenase
MTRPGRSVPWAVRLLFALPPERAHEVAMCGLRLLSAAPRLSDALRRRLGADDPILRTQALGLTFANPIGLAAGFDKDARAFPALAALGFGFVEVGTLTAQAQPGNPRPRLFRLPADRALVNRLGFNNAGAGAARPRLAARRPADGVVGVNVGKSKSVPPEGAVADYERSVALLAPVADYLVVNVSSPNTPGLRALQAVEALRPLLSAVQDAARRARPERPPAVLVKIAPDLSDSELDAIADLALDLELDGIVATNTTIARPQSGVPLEALEAIGAGGLSGAPLASRALEVLERLHARLAGRLVLVSVGGVQDAADAWERIRAGATLVQVYTGFVYGGPLSPARIARGVAARARAAGYANVAQAVGTMSSASAR